ncbi:MAG: Na+/H+ antiporter subunit E [Deltaproteobacteria bacterium]|nr:Na+/H+ antiporter subunit E [Deltaproteobacteria bacterium]
MMTLILNILLAFLWSVMIGEFTPANIAFGFLLGYVALRLAWNRGGQPNRYFRKFFQLAGLFAFFIKELVVANVRVAVQTLSPLDSLRPGILAIPIDPMTDTEITILSSFITLTPGTLTMDVAADRSTLFIHFMHIADAEAQRREIREGFARRVMEAMR